MYNHRRSEWLGDNINAGDDMAPVHGVHGMSGNMTKWYKIERDNQKDCSNNTCYDDSLSNKYYCLRSNVKYLSV